LVTFGTQTILTFGVFTGFGILSAVVIELTLIPAMRALLPAPAAREREAEAHAHRFLDRGLTAIATVTRTRPGAVMLGALALVVLCIALASRVEVNMSLKGQFREED